MTQKRKKISVVIPFFNEVESLPIVYEELLAVRRNALVDYDFEIVLMDNHSTDGSFELAADLASRDAEAKVVRLSRNFGYQSNILAGYMQSTGDAVVQLDADGEDNPVMIAAFVSFWEQGYKVVYGIRRQRAENFVLTLQRRIFYRVLNLLSTVPIPIDAGDFRLIDRQVVDVLGTFRESQIYLRGLIAFAGFNQKGIPYDRRPRYRGTSKFSWFNYISLAWIGIASFSSKPLRMVTWLGMFLSAMSFCGCIFYLGLYVFVGVPARGFTTMILVQLMLAGVQLLCVGLMGSYIGLIFEEVKRRPRAIIECTRGNERVPLAKGADDAKGTI